MSDWVEPYADAGWSFNDRKQSVTSTGDAGWFISLRTLIDDEGRYLVRMTTQDAGGEHKRAYAFTEFNAIADSKKAYKTFITSLIEWGPRITKRNRGDFAKDVAAQARARGATLIWIKGDEKRIEM